VKGNQVQRVSLGIPADGVILYNYVTALPPQDSPLGTGIWTKITPSVITIYRSFSSIEIEPDSGIQNVEDGAITVYFGSEREDDSEERPLGKMVKSYRREIIKNRPELLAHYPNL
jgi:hypothetical protein